MWASFKQLKGFKKKKKLSFLRKEILPQDCSINSHLSIQPAGLPHRFQIFQPP